MQEWIIQGAIHFAVTMYHKSFTSAKKDTYFTHLHHHQILKKTFSHFFHFLHLPQMLSPLPCHDFQVPGNRFSSPFAITVEKLPYRLELCFLLRQREPWLSDTWSSANHRFYHVQWSEHVIPYQVTCLLEQRDVSKKKASHTQGSDRASYCYPLVQLAHTLANVCCVPYAIDVVIGGM